MVALLRFAVLLLLPVISLSLPASDSSDGLELRQAPSPAAEIIDILSKSMLPRVQAFGGAASSLDSRSSATDLYVSAHHNFVHTSKLWAVGRASCRQGYFRRQRKDSAAHSGNFMSASFSASP